jgi:hypothetical protein
MGHLAGGFGARGRDSRAARLRRRAGTCAGRGGAGARLQAGPPPAHQTFAQHPVPLAAPPALAMGAHRYRLLNEVAPLRRASADRPPSSQAVTKPNKALADRGNAPLRSRSRHQSSLLYHSRTSPWLPIPPCPLLDDDGLAPPVLVRRRPARPLRPAPRRPPPRRRPDGDSRAEPGRAQAAGASIAAPVAAPAPLRRRSASC